MILRDANPADAATVAAIHAASWRSAYAHFMDPAYLTSRIEGERMRHWAGVLEAGAAAQRIILAEVDGRAIGFANLIGGDDPRWGTLVDNLHALPEAKGKGLGSALLAEAARWTMERFPGAGLHLFCYADNRAARGFYEHKGGVVVENRSKPGPDGRNHAELRFHWGDPARLLG